MARESGLVYKLEGMFEVFRESITKNIDELKKDLKVDIQGLKDDLGGKVSRENFSQLQTRLEQEITARKLLEEQLEPYLTKEKLKVEDKKRASKFIGYLPILLDIIKFGAAIAFGIGLHESFHSFYS